jgi:uncharacterized protein (DUF433 family)
MATEVLERHIESKAGVVGGKPHIAGRRITVQNIIIWHEKMGKSADEICSEYELNLAEVYAALSYYFDHREEIDQSIEESQALVAELSQKTPSVLHKKLKTYHRE